MQSEKSSCRNHWDCQSAWKPIYGNKVHKGLTDKTTRFELRTSSWLISKIGGDTFENEPMFQPKIWQKRLPNFAKKKTSQHATLCPSCAEVRVDLRGRRARRHPRQVARRQPVRQGQERFYLRAREPSFRFATSGINGPFFQLIFLDFLVILLSFDNHLDSSGIFHNFVREIDL